MTGPARALMPDYLRLVALFGIVVVNVQFIAFSALGSIADPGGETLRDAITLWLSPDGAAMDWIAHPTCWRTSPHSDGPTSCSPANTDGPKGDQTALA